MLLENLLRSTMTTTMTDDSRASWAEHPRASAIRWKDELPPEKEDDEVQWIIYFSRD